MFTNYDREKQLKETEQFLEELEEELEEKQIYEKQSLQEMSRLSKIFAEKKTTSDKTMTILDVAEGLGKIVSKLSFFEGEKISESIYKNQFRDLKRFVEQSKKNAKYFDEIKDSIEKYYQRLQNVNLLEHKLLNNELEVLSDMREDAETGFNIILRQIKTTKDENQKKEWRDLYNAYKIAINIALRLVKNRLQNDDLFMQTFLDQNRFCCKI